MKKISRRTAVLGTVAAAAIVAVAVLLPMAFSGSGSPSSPVPDAGASPRVPASPEATGSEAAGSAAATSGAGQTGPSAASSGTADATEPGAGTPSASPTPVPSVKAAETDPGTGAKVTTDARGQVVKKLGQAGVLTDDAGREMFSIKINAVRSMKSCSVRGIGGTAIPDSKVFLVVNVTASMPAEASALTEGSNAAMPLGAESFAVAAGADAPARGSLDTQAAFACELKRPLDFQVEAGHRTTGDVVLDSPLASGQLAYSPEGAAGWTWAF